MARILLMKQIKLSKMRLNTAMGNLKQAIADKDATKATVNFTDADQAKQQAYNTACGYKC